MLKCDKRLYRLLTGVAQGKGTAKDRLGGCGAAAEMAEGDSSSFWPHLHPD
jgi:hypothetical protein